VPYCLSTFAVKLFSFILLFTFFLLRFVSFLFMPPFTSGFSMFCIFSFVCPSLT
jgi:hypothetical protein